MCVSTAVVCVAAAFNGVWMGRQRREVEGWRLGGGGGGRWGEEREKLFTRADQEYNAFLEDESGGRRLLADRLRGLGFISPWLHMTDLWTLRLSNTTRSRQLQQRRDKGREWRKSQRKTQKEEVATAGAYSCQGETGWTAAVKLELNIDWDSLRWNCWENLSLRFRERAWETWEDEGGFRGRGLVGSNCGDSQCEVTQTHVRHRGFKI